MTLLIKIVCLLLCCVASNCDTEPENQHCGDQKFYCPTTDQCFDRNQRCTASKVCVNSQGKEAKCYENGTAGLYNYYRKETPVTDFGSSSRKKRDIWSTVRHWFVEYRGFVYEFGNYGFQELDVNGPNYKYGPGRSRVTSQTLVGSSRCTRGQVLSFGHAWLRANPKYRLFKSNCQHFANRLFKELGNHCSGRVRRQDDDDDDDDDDESLKADCPLDSSSTSSGSSLALSWKRFALVGPLIAFANFYIN